jgi:hypothetical protein
MLRQTWVRVLAAGALLLVSAAVLASSGTRDFRIRDDCDPATFNATFGPPDVCLPNFDGDTTVEEFLEELAEDQEVGSWRFNPDEVTMDRGERTVFESRGGEFHTFTRVEEFGGGILPDLNELSGVEGVRPECGDVEQLKDASPTNVFVGAGAKLAGPRAGSAALPRGTTKWQCCIHPWMRSTIKVR